MKRWYFSKWQKIKSESGLEDLPPGNSTVALGEYVWIFPNHHSHAYSCCQNTSVWRRAECPVMTTAINVTISVTDSLSTSVPDPRQRRLLVCIHICCYSPHNKAQAAPLWTENSEHKHHQTHQPRMIDEQHPLAVGVSPSIASHEWEGLISKVTNEITWTNLRGKPQDV